MNRNNNKASKDNNPIKSFWKDESGEIGIKQIAITVAVIVILGFVIMIFRDGPLLNDWLEDIWEIFTNAIKGLVE